MHTGKSNPQRETKMDISNQNRKERLVIEVSKEEYEAYTKASGAYKSNPYIAEPPAEHRTLIEETVDKGITFLERHRWLVRFLGLGVFLSITGVDLTKLIIYFGDNLLW